MRSWTWIGRYALVLAVAALLTVDSVERPVDERRYELPAGHAWVLTLSDRPETMAAPYTA